MRILQILLTLRRQGVKNEVTISGSVALTATDQPKLVLSII